MARLLLALASALALGACVAVDPDVAGADSRADAELSGWRGSVYVGPDLSQARPEKVIVVSYLVSGAGVQPTGAVVGYGFPGRLPSAGADFTIAAVTPEGRALDSVAVEDPRKAIVENQGIVESAEGSLVTRLAFDPGAAAVRVTSPDGVVVAETDLRSAIDQFCRATPRDPDCARRAAGDRAPTP